MDKLEELIKSLKEAKEIMNKDEADDKIAAKMKALMDKRGFTGKNAADHYRDIDESIPAVQRSNIKNSLKAQEEKAKKPKLEIAKSVEDQAEELIKSLEALSKGITIPPPRTIVPSKSGGQSGWSQDKSNGSFHHGQHGVIQTTHNPETGHYDVKHNGKPLGSFPSLPEAGSRIKEHMENLKHLKTDIRSTSKAPLPPVIKDEDGVDMEKSNYGPKGAGLYSETDNIKRKANNIGESVDNAGKNVNVKSYSSKAGQLSAKASAALQAARDSAKNKAQPVKVATPEEVAAMNAKLKKSEVEWSEQEAAKNLAKAMPVPVITGQPTDVDFERILMQSGAIVSEEQAEAINKSWGDTIQDFFAEASKPIGQRFASQEEEDAYWRSIKVGGGGRDSDSGY